MAPSSSNDIVGPIIFANQTARHQLVSQGEVVTFRKSKRTTGETWWRKSRNGTKEGDVTVREIGVIDPKSETELEEYLPLSGFKTVSDWQQSIANLNGSLPSQGRLYHVKA